MDAPRRRIAWILAAALAGGAMFPACGGDASAMAEASGALLRQSLRAATRWADAPAPPPPAAATVTIGVRA